MTEAAFSSSYGAVDVHLADADVRVEHEDLVACLVDVRVDVVPVRVLAEDVHLAELRVAVDAHRDVTRYDHVELAYVDTRLDTRLATREVDVSEVDRQVADPELVVTLHVACAHGDVRLVTRPVAEVHVERSSEGGRC